MRWLLRLLRRVADDDLSVAKRRYLAALLRAARVLPGDEAISRLIEEHEKAEQAMRTARR